MLIILQGHQFHTRSQKALQSPAYQQPKACVMEMGRKIAENHRQTRPGIDRPPTSLDTLLDSVNTNGQPFTEEQLLSEALGPYLAGQDTVASTLTF